MRKFESKFQNIIDFATSKQNEQYKPKLSEQFIPEFQQKILEYDVQQKEEQEYQDQNQREDQDEKHQNQYQDQNGDQNKDQDHNEQQRYYQQQNEDHIGDQNQNIDVEQQNINLESQVQISEDYQKSQRFDPSKSLQRESIQNNETIYVLSQAARQQQEEVEEVDINLILRFNNLSSLPQNVALPQKTTFKELSEFFIFEHKLKENLQYYFFQDEQKTILYDLNKSLQQSNIRDNQIIYAQYYIPEEYNRKIEEAKNQQTAEQKKFVQDSHIINQESETINLDIKMSGQLITLELSKNTTFHELSDHFVEENHKDGSKVSYIFYKDFDRKKPYQPDQSLQSEKIKSEDVVYANLFTDPEFETPTNKGQYDETPTNRGLYYDPSNNGSLSQDSLIIKSFNHLNQSIMGQIQDSQTNTIIG